MAPFVGFADADEAHYAAAAERVGMTAGAMHRAVFDFRTQHRDLLRSIVADTVADPADVDSEITALLCACDLPVAAGRAAAPLPTAIRTFKPEELLVRAMHTVQMTSGRSGKWTPPNDAEAARLFPQFEMLGMLGRGGMGAVYRARQVALDREVAIKLLPLEVSVDQAFADRFVREARAMAKLTHPNIISVFDFGTTAEGHLYFVMEYVEGANVAQIIRGPGLDPEQALVITGQVCTALAYAHGKGVIHRDIKPANVMVGTDGTAKVADFGLARMSGADPEQYGQTVTGTVMGTPEYMAPEQKRGMVVDHRADIYSIGVMLYEMLCKEPPQGTFEPPSQRAGCDARIDQIVLKAMNRMPEGRYQSTVEMKSDIDDARTPLPASPERRPPGGTMNPGRNQPFDALPKKSPGGLIVALMAAALLAGGVLHFLNGGKPSTAESAVRTAPTAVPERTPAPAPEPAGPPIPADFKFPEIVANAPPAKENPPATPNPPLTGPKGLAIDMDVPRATPSGEGLATLPAPPKPKPPMAPNVAASPAASALVAASKDPYLLKLETAFRARFESDAQKPYLASIAALNQSYLVNGVTRARLAAQVRGSLDEVTALDAEKDAVGKGQGVPAADEAGTPESLKNLRVQYRAALGKYNAERARIGGQLYDFYLTALDARVSELTRANKIEEAIKVKALRGEIAEKKAELTPTIAVEPAKTGLVSADPRALTGGSVRDAAKWILANGGRCRIAKGNLENEALTERELPAGKFEILGFTLDRRDPTKPVLPASDFQVLKSLRTLRYVWIFSPGLGDAAGDFLAENPELTSVALHSEGFTDGVLANLAAARKLTEFTLVYAKGFTGRGLEKMRWLPGLTKADFSSCGISDEGLKELLSAARLRTLKLVGRNLTATDAGLAALATHPALSELGIEDCKAFTDAGFAVLSKLKTLTVLDAPGTNFGDAAASAWAGHAGIRQLNLRGTPLTDAGLAKLASLNKLQTLNLSGTKVTPDGVEAFKKAVPKCQVVR